MGDPVAAKTGTSKSRYPWLMRGLGTAYLLGALFFFLFPNELIYLINVGPRVFRLGEAIPDHSDSIWNLWASALSATLAATSFFASSSSSSGASSGGYLWIHQLAKVVMITGAAYFFLNSHRYFAYLLIAAVEAALFLFVCWSWLLRPRSPA